MLAFCRRMSGKTILVYTNRQGIQQHQLVQLSIALRQAVWDCRPRRGAHLTALHCAGAMATGGVAALVASTPEEQRCAHRMTSLHSCLQAGAKFLLCFCFCLCWMPCSPLLALAVHVRCILGCLNGICMLAGVCALQGSDGAAAMLA